MAPKKKGEKMSLGDFLGEGPTSWADEMEDMPISDSRSTGYGGSKTGYSSNANTYSTGTMGGYFVREELPLPTKPPYTVHLGNLSFDATTRGVEEFFAGCECTNVRIIEDKMEMKPKGYGYAEFATLDGLKEALSRNQTQFQGRNIRISVADPRKDRGDGLSRDFGDWSRKGPLPDLPGRNGDRGGDRRASEYGADRRERRDAVEGDGKMRDFGNWERKGPLSPLAQPDRGPREGDRPRSNDGPRKDFADRRVSPAAWGEGRPQGSQEGSRPPRREFQERPHIERVPTAAEQDNQWRTKMRPDPPVTAVKSPVVSQEGSEAPSSPAIAAAPLSRPKLNLAKRTVPEAPESSPSSTTSDAKASPFGAARPIDTAAKGKEIEEKRLAAIQEKKEAEEQVKAENEAVKVAAEAAEAAKKEAMEREQKVEILQRPEGQGETKTGETMEKENANGKVIDDKAVKPKEVPARDAKSRISDTGAWRRPSGGKSPHDDVPRGTRGRVDYAPRGPRHHNTGRPPRHNTNGGVSPRSPAPPVDSETAALEEAGWSTVSKSKKNGRAGGGQAARAIAS